MRAYIHRTSMGLDIEDAMPCPGCHRDIRPIYDRRFFKSFEEHDARFPNQPWLSRGTEHKIEYGPRGGATGISRRVEDAQAWVIEMSSLADLLELVKREGPIIVSTVYHKDFELEIYDYYRE